MSDQDRKLLELAAKAAGLTLCWIGDQPTVRYTPEESEQRNGIDGYHWNPLTNGADTQRLQVALYFFVKVFRPSFGEIVAPGFVEVWREDDEDPIHTEWYDHCADRFEASQRAVVRAAATLGRHLS